MHTCLPSIKNEMIKRKQVILGEGNLIFCCTGPTHPNFHHIKIIIILISHVNTFL